MLEYFCHLLKKGFGPTKTGEVWGIVILKYIISLRVNNYKTESLILFKTYKSKLIIDLIVGEEILHTINSRSIYE